MKRKLPQWLLDATNNEKSKKPNSLPSALSCSKSVTHNGDYNNENIEPEQDISNPRNIESNQVQNNGSIKIVPLANLLLPSHGGVIVHDSNQSIHTSDTSIEMRDQISQTQSNLEIPSNELQSVTVPSISNLQDSSANNQLEVVIKTEIKDDPEDEEPQVVVKQEIKEEPANYQPEVVVKQEIKNEPAATAVSSNPVVQNVGAKTQRLSCNYGIKCFR